MTKIGRPCIGLSPMTNAERQQRRRQRDRKRNRKMGRPCLGRRAMTNAERQRRWRRRKRFFVGVGNSSRRHDWETPAPLAAALNAAVGMFDLDPCAATHDPALARVKALRLLPDGGLAVPWTGLVYCNPPYGRTIARWIEKCATEKATVVALLAARTDARWWHSHVAGRAEVLFLCGRLRFGDGTNSAPFPSAIVIWRGTPEIVTQITSNIGPHWRMQ